MPQGIPYVPEAITVHLGPPDSDARNVTVPFSDYIKNVASSEIYPTWPESALRANILAQISFALNRVYTEYYRSRGYDFNITNSTVIDQSFINGRNVFDTVSQITDEIFNDYLRRQSFVEPLFARYCNGTTVTCEGLSQWGSVDLAEAGYNSVQIIRNYYGDDVEIVVEAPVMGITSSVPSRNLRLGATGNDVQAIQLRLNRISQNYPSIPKIPDVNGYYGIETRDAVTEFQTIFDLAADGIVGRATWYKIQQIYAGVKRLNELRSEGIAYSDISRVYPEALTPGYTGSEVNTVQYMLNYVAKYEDTVEPFPISGTYDQATEAAIRGFQRTYGLPDNGILDEKTYARLFDVYNSLILSFPEEMFAATARPYPGYVIGPGFDSPYVTYLQEYLTVISGVIASIPAPGNSGVYDEQTEASIRALQRYAGLPETGFTNLATWTALSDLYNDIRAGETVQPEQYPGYVID